MVWWQILLTGLSGFCAGLLKGRYESQDEYSSKKFEHMENLVAQANERTYLMERKWREAEQRAETWERRYTTIARSYKLDNVNNE